MAAFGNSIENKALDAPPFFSATQGTEKIKPPLIRNQYGFLIGGPIRKNRTFFLGAYEGLKLPGSQTFVGHLPTAAEKNGDFSNYAALLLVSRFVCTLRSVTSSTVRGL
jgi:putative AlgH/UPF0301 family transcriptional regulator